MKVVSQLPVVIASLALLALPACDPGGKEGGGKTGSSIAKALSAPDAKLAAEKRKKAEEKNEANLEFDRGSLTKGVIPKMKLDKFLDFIRMYYPDLDETRLHPDYTGIRPKLYGPGEPVRDFVIDRVRCAS